MASGNDFENVGIIKEEEMENVELHRSSSMVSEQVEIMGQLKPEKSNQEKESVTSYVGRIIRVILSLLKNMKLEVIMFLYYFSYVLRSITNTTMIIEKVCIVHLKQSQDVCDHLAQHSDVKVMVEKLANNYNLGHSLIQLVPSAFICLFVGSWSDTYGRKVPIIVALIGIILDGLGTTVCAHFLHSRAEYIFIPAIFTGLSGGFISTLLILYSYVADISTPSNRTMKFALLEVAFSISMPLGSLAGGWIFKYYRYVPVFLTSTCGHILGLFWTILILDETRGLDVTDSWMVKLQRFWSLDSILKSYKTTVKRRPNRGREQIWLLIIAMSLAVFCFTAIVGVVFIYVQHIYDWDNTTYSTVSAIFSTFQMILMLIVVPSSKKFHIAEPYLGIAGTVSIILKCICIGLANSAEIFYLANILGLFGGLCSLASRSRISKLVPQEDMGKVFAFLTMAESLMPIVSTAVGTQIFNATLEVFPGLLFILMGILMFFPLGVYIWMARLPKVDYDTMVNQPDNTDDHVQGKVLHTPEDKLNEKY